MINETVNSITVIINPDHGFRDTFIIANPIYINKITDIINSANREPILFIPEYRLVIHMKDSIKIVNVNKENIGIWGIHGCQTFRINEDLGKLLQMYFEESKKSKK